MCLSFFVHKPRCKHLQGLRSKTDSPAPKRGRNPVSFCRNQTLTPVVLWFTYKDFTGREETRVQCTSAGLWSRALWKYNISKDLTRRRKGRRQTIDRDMLSLDCTEKAGGAGEPCTHCLFLGWMSCDFLPLCNRLGIFLGTPRPFFLNTTLASLLNCSFLCALNNGLQRPAGEHTVCRGTGSQDTTSPPSHSNTRETCRAFIQTLLHSYTVTQHQKRKQNQTLTQTPCKLKWRKHTRHTFHCDTHTAFSQLCITTQRCIQTLSPEWQMTPEHSDRSAGQTSSIGFKWSVSGSLIRRNLISNRDRSAIGGLSYLSEWVTVQSEHLWNVDGQETTHTGNKDRQLNTLESQLLK